MFIGRKSELELIKNELNKQSSAILVYGKRKVGKTTLIRKACEDFTDKTIIYFECIKSTLEDNVELFTLKLKSLGLLDKSLSLENKTFIGVFEYLNNLNKHFVVIIDEYSYLKEGDNGKVVDSTFQSIIDNNLSNINLFLSGSHIGVMKSLLEENNALFGRFTLVINLKELNYLEASEFYSKKTPYEKVGFYAVFGGSPYVLSFIDPDKSLKENIINLYLDFKSHVFIYADNFLLSDYSNEYQVNRLLNVIGNSKKTYSDLETFIDPKKTGNLSKIIKPLLQMDLLNKRVSINKKPNEKNGRYEINDNVLRFFYTYIAKNKSNMLDMNLNAFFDEFIEPSLKTFISYRFESIGHNFISNKVRNGEIKDAIMVGSYYYDDPVTKTNGEFDIVIKKKNCFDVIDAKYLKDKLSKDIVFKEISQIKEIKDFKVDKIGFISINGYEDGIPPIDYKFEGKDLF